MELDELTKVLRAMGSKLLHLEVSNSGYVYEDTTPFCRILDILLVLNAHNPELRYFRINDDLPPVRDLEDLDMVEHIRRALRWLKRRAPLLVFENLVSEGILEWDDLNTDDELDRGSTL